MKKFLLFILAYCLSLSVSAQKVYFIYFESDNQPFYLKMGDKVYSSSTPGYLLLSNLKDSNYTFFIGFPAGQTRETKFQVNIKGADRGFAIKNVDGVLQLFDLQNLNLIKPIQDQVAGNIKYEARTDAFTSLLSRAAGDSSLLLAPILVKADVLPKEEKKEPAESTEVKSMAGDSKPKTDQQEAKPQTDLAAVRPDSIHVKTDTIGKTADANGIMVEEPKGKKTQTAEVAQVHSATVDSTTTTQPVEEYRKTSVKRYSESSTSEGFGLIFFDTDGEQVDTIRLIIPNPKIVIHQPDTTQEEKLFLEINKDSLKQAPPATEVVSVPGSQKKPCEKQATENDFFKLRKNMAAKATDEAMVDEARRLFKAKCFTTEQVKNLGALFLTSAGKYQFFDAAYLHVSDQEQFASLQSEIKDEYYLKRFKALIGE